MNASEKVRTLLRLLLGANGARRWEPGLNQQCMRRLAGLALGLGCAATAGAAPGAFELRSLAALADEGAIAAIAIGDLDGNGSNDVYLAYGNRSGAGGVETPLRDLALLSSGGAFVPASATFDAAAPAAAAGVVLADFDRDGDLDVLVAGSASYNGTTEVAAPTQLFRNLGGGNFGAPQLLGFPSSKAGIAAADIDADGDSDVAISDFRGSVQIYRNDTTPGGAINLVPAQSLIVGSGSDARSGSIAFGDFNADGRLDLVVLRVQDSGSVSNPQPRGAVYFENRVTGGFAPLAVVPLPDGFLTGLAVADFDLDGRADVAVSAAVNTILPGTTSGASRVLRSTPTGPVITAVRFPPHSHSTVVAGDLDADGRPDLIFARRPCAPTLLGCLDNSLSTLVTYFGTGSSFLAGPQCIGAHADGPRALALGLLNGDALRDVVFSGQRPPQGGDGLGWLRNDATPGTRGCCVAELAGDLSDGEPQRSPLGGALPGVVDIGALARVRDVLMPDASNGTRLRNRYAQFSPEVVALMRTDPTLWRDAATTLGLWSRPVRDLVDGRGAQRFVDQPMIDAVDALLQRLSTAGSPALAAAIADERSRLPAFSTFVGLSMNDFRAIALPSDVLLRNGFETP